jgi:YidC/Oxa1 family membrane protein insertase
MLASLTTPIGKIFQPLLDFVGSVLAFFFSIVPNYPIDVALLTIVIMAALTPLTVKSTKNMAAMQALGPEMKKLQQKYKGAENRAQMNEEMMKLYKEHNVNPASGCLPMLLQMPAFFVLYSVIRGITNTVTKTIPAHTTPAGLKVSAQTVVTAIPRYIPDPSKMRTDIVAAHGQLNSFGINFAEKLLSHHSSIWIAIPYLLLVAAAVALQYLQMARLNARNPQAAQANPQAAMLQKYMPLIFGFIYLNVAAILNVYFIVSSAIRILTQEILFRKGLVAGPPAAGSGPVKKGPPIDRSEKALPKPKAGTGTGAGKTRSGSTGTGNGTGGGAKAPARKAPAGKSGSNGQATTGTGARGPTKAAGPKKPSGIAGGSSNGTNGQKPAAGGNGSGASRTSGQGAGRGSGSTSPKNTRANGSNGPSPDTGDTADSDGPPKEHPRSKAKRARKAR